MLEGLDPDELAEADKAPATDAKDGPKKPPKQGPKGSPAPFSPDDLPISPEDKAAFKKQAKEMEDMNN